MRIWKMFSVPKLRYLTYPIHELIAKRWSARAFSTRPVEKSKLLSILEAARLASSSRNEQPWRYIIFTNDNPEKLKNAQSVLKDINNYAKRAPILICSITKKTYSDNGNYNRLHFHDFGAANENMFLESFNQGIIMHEMACMKWEAFMFREIGKSSTYLKTLKSAL